MKSTNKTVICRLFPIAMRLPLFALLLSLPASAAWGQDVSPAPERAKNTGCVDVVVNGRAALSYDCLNEQLTPNVEASGPRTGTLESEAITQRGPNAMGLPNPATIGNRMGNQFGQSAFPQRPPTPHSAPHLIGK
ncbi:hypothetical protein MID00_16310 [Alcaligenes sp. NLF5-7]|uniref:hypothetical protein n=1 Tax=Alcaligenes sp. NLF5-7 TaxID=2918755 RepID=UPI0020C3883C|nr:hypothetical protein [Alcaligenes sp. NLF5-7]UTM01041.1 hypothetical protein MID00_16310 [Alcaligenes sp. NLF5-7]